MLIHTLEPNFIHEDDRGKLTQLVRNGYAQINVITSQKGAFRGGHFHKQNREAFYVIEGSFRLETTFGQVQETYTFHAGDMFCIPPNVLHSFLFFEDTKLVSMYDVGVELPDQKMDIYTEL